MDAGISWKKFGKRTTADLDDASSDETYAYASDSEASKASKASEDSDDTPLLDSPAYKKFKRSSLLTASSSVMSSSSPGPFQVNDPPNTPVNAFDTTDADERYNDLRQRAKTRVSEIREKARADRKRLKKELKTARDENEVLKSENDLLKDQNDALTTQIERLKGKIKALEKVKSRSDEFSFEMSTLLKKMTRVVNRHSEASCAEGQDGG